MLDRLTLGDHICWTLDDEAARLDVIASCARAGLNSRQRVVYCGDHPLDVLAGMERRGVRVAAALATGQLRAVTAEETSLADGHFDPDATARRWRTAVKRTIRDGYRGVRVISDMSWAARGVPGAEYLPWYESWINSFFAESPVIAVCAYDRRLFDPMSLRRIAWSHPGLAGPDLPYDPDFSLRIRRTTEPWGLRLAGEADLSNRTAMEAVLDDLCAGTPAGATATVDVTGLRFADNAAARVLIETAAGGPGRIRVVGASRALTRLLAFHGADRVDRLLLS